MTDGFESTDPEVKVRCVQTLYTFCGTSSFMLLQEGSPWVPRKTCSKRLSATWIAKGRW